MIQKLIHRLLLRRHYWRHVGFTELSELYASEFMRSLSISVIGIFVPIYLYQLGYSLQSIFAMQAIWAGSRPIFSYISAKTIALIGPKHTIALGTMSQISYLILLVSIDKMNWPLAILGLLGSLSYALFGIALQVDFSKVKHSEHGGKELSFITICERIGSSIGPLVGGLVASFVSPRATITIAISIMALSLIPLFQSAEPMKVKQKIILKGFPWRRHKYDFISAPFLGIENIVSLVIWPLFAALTVFTTNTYAAVGLVISISTAAALVAIYTIGRLIDDHRGGLLLRSGAIANSVVHIFRIFVTTPAQVFFVSLINEPMTASYRMPYTKGLYDAADSVPGYRIVYLTLFDLVRMLGVFMFWMFAYVATFFISSNLLLFQIMFLIGAITSLGVMLQRFPALR
jgi:MFS family permease